MTELLEIDGLHVHYNRVPAVTDVSLTVAEGEVVGVIGPNGAGKTTTLSALFGLVRITSGEVLFQGTSIKGRSPEDIARAGLALVPEGRHVFQSLTVQENLQLGAAPRGGRKALKDGIAEALELFPGLQPHLRHAAGDLSGGEQQQLAIGRALLSRPRLLLLDEPSLGLAPKIVDSVFTALSDLRTRGMTILLVEQNATRTVAFADRVYVLGGGRVVAVGNGAQLTANGVLTDAYLGSVAP
jgi:branched-chain amino acid transport system ATP-binding protein